MVHQEAARITDQDVLNSPDQSQPDFVRSKTEGKQIFFHSKR